jgi:hypothetical protein
VKTKKHKKKLPSAESLKKRLLDQVLTEKEPNLIVEEAPYSMIKSFSEKTAKQQRSIWYLVFFSLSLDIVLLNPQLNALLIAGPSQPRIEWAIALLILALLLSFQDFTVKTYQEALNWQRRTSRRNKLIYMGVGLVLVGSLVLHEAVEYFARADVLGALFGILYILGHFIGTKDKTKDKPGYQAELQKVTFLAQTLLAPSYLARMGSLLAVMSLSKNQLSDPWSAGAYIASAAVIMLVSFPQSSALIGCCRICARSLPQPSIYRAICYKCRQSRPGL